MSNSDSIYFSLNSLKNIEYEIEIKKLKDKLNFIATLPMTVPKRIFNTSISFLDLKAIKYLSNCVSLERIMEKIITIIENGNSSITENQDNILLLKFSPNKNIRNEFSFELIEEEISSKEKTEALYLSINNITKKVIDLEKENTLLKQQFENHQNLYNRNLQDIISMIKTLKEQKDSEIISLQYEINSLKKNAMIPNPYSTNTLSYKNNNINNSYINNTYKTQTINNNLQLSSPLNNPMNNTMNNINVNNSINNNNDPFKTFTAVQDRDTIPIQIIEAHLGPINHISVFPNGTFISVSDDCSIKLFDKDCLLISNLENAHENSIQYISIKNNYEFVTCSDDRSLKIWHLNNNIIELYKEIKNAHIQAISCVIYTSLGNIISCSIDKFIKIRFGNFYEKVTVLVNTDTVAVFSLLEIDNDILVSGGWEGIKFWDLKKKMKINSINNCSVVNCDALARIDTDKIAVGGDKYGIIKIISISKKQIIMEINNFTQCLALMGIFYKGLFASGGEDCAIKLYSVENYDCVKEITRAHEGGVNGFCKIRNEILVSYGADGNIKVWNV